GWLRRLVGHLAGVGCRERGERREDGDEGEFSHGTSFLIEGGCNTGGRSGGMNPFSTSSRSMSRLGAEAETGTQPLSAPHTPLNVSISRLAARIDCSATSGVPLMSMPRTSSFLPSGDSRYAITGLTLNAWGWNAEGLVNPPLMSGKVMADGRFRGLILSIHLFY